MWLRRRSLDPGGVDPSPCDPVVEEFPALAGISGASIQGRIALGSRAGARVWRVGNNPEAPWVLSTAPRHAHIAGFDLHANVAVPGRDRVRREQLCRYLLCPAVAQDRLGLLADGRVVLEGINLSEIRPGRYELICFLLRLRGLDGAPCRAVLREITG